MEGPPVAEVEMECRELVELVTHYLEGALPPHERARFEEHLEQCPYCWTYLEQMRATIAETGTLDEESLSEPARSVLLDAFRGWTRG